APTTTTPSPPTTPPPTSALAQVTVGDYMGKPEAGAVARVVSDGLVPSVVHQDGAACVVISQSPAPGSHVDAGTRVQLTGGAIGCPSPTPTPQSHPGLYSGQDLNQRLH